MKNTHRPMCSGPIRFNERFVIKIWLKGLRKRLPEDTYIIKRKRKNKNQMKLLENLSFESLGEALSTEDCIDGRIDAKLESYRFVALANISPVSSKTHKMYSVVN